MEAPRPEYPRPQCVRDDWLCLNGQWQFAFDPADSGLERGLVDAGLPDRITVPFCPESGLSGIGDTDFHRAVWYRRRVALPAAWAGRRVLLHCQAVDYDATIWVDGVEAVRHRGGFTPFTTDLGAAPAGGGERTIVIRARDDGRARKPQGKQCTDYANAGCHYTRTTGIWQTVWLEPVPDRHLRRPRITPRAGLDAFDLVAPLGRPGAGQRVRARLIADGDTLDEAEADAASGVEPRLRLAVPDGHRRPWCPEDPFLYDLEIELLDADGEPIDRVLSYAGLRSVRIDGHRILLNDRPVFQRLVLDQGYYPTGIMTAPSDRDLVADIEAAQAMGFNGARLHQKVFEERFLYHADRLGYLVWGEFADWSSRGHGARPTEWGPMTYATQWAEALERDLSHPSIVGWCPVNEAIIRPSDAISGFDDVVVGLYRITKLVDPSRPVIDSSGWSHRVAGADVYDIHRYDQEADALDGYVRSRQAGELSADHERTFQDLAYDADAGRPFMVSEFGGIWWNAELAAAAAAGRDRGESWGYGERVADLEGFYRRFAALCGVLLDNPRLCGYCYTQLTDVYQEQNGLYAFDRGHKFDAERLRAVQARPAAIEAGNG